MCEKCFFLILSELQLNFHGAQADGVTVKYKDNSLAKIRAAKEVILCAGTIGTPQLLMLSGIGPIDQLQKFKVEWLPSRGLFFIIVVPLRIYNLIYLFFFRYLLLPTAQKWAKIFSTI